MQKILQSTGRRESGMQKKRWEDNVTVDRPGVEQEGGRGPPEMEEDCYWYQQPYNPGGSPGHR